MKPDGIFSVMRTTLIVNRRKWLLYILVLIGVMAFFATVSTQTVIADPQTKLVSNFNQLTYLYLFIYITSLMFSTSLLCSNLTSKEDRISAFMMPAGQGVKFLARTLLLTVGFTLVYLVCIEVSELIRILFTYLLGPSNGGVYCNYYLHLNLLRGLGWEAPGVVLAVGSFLFIQSLYAIGATVWPRLSFVKTSAALSLLSIAMAIIMVAIVAGMSVSEADFNFSYKAPIADGIVMMAWSVVNWVIAYLRYRETDVISHWYHKTPATS